MRSLCVAVAIALALASGANAQVLTTTFASNNGQSGNMFDLVAINTVTICSFDVNLDPGTWNMEIYTKNSPYLPDVNNAAAWGAPIATLMGVVSNGLNVPTPLTLQLNVTIPAGATQAFYVTVTNGTAINYTNGAAGSTGTVFAADANLQFLAGAGLAYPFLSNFNPRIFNGNIYYTVGGGACPAAPWQVNQPQLSLDINGVMTGGGLPAISPSCVGTTATVNFGGSLVGAPFDIAATIGTTTVPLGGGGVLLPASQQVVNVNIFDPTFTLIFGGTFTTPFVPFSAPITQPPIEVDAQLVALDVTSPDGIRLSQAVCAQPVTPAAGPLPGPATDDSSVTVALGAPNCWLPGGFTFCGTTYTQIFVSSNGRILFGGADTDFSASIAEGLTDNPFFGIWCDLNPATAGSISITNPAPNVVQADWVGVPYFAQAATSNTFSLQLDGNTNSVSILGLQGTTSPPTNATFLGLTCGNLGATDGGQQMFTIGGSGTGVMASDMLYEFVAAAAALPAFTAGVNNITFVPGGGLNYVWAAN